MFDFSLWQTIVVVALVYFAYFVGRNFDAYWVIARGMSDNIMDSYERRKNGGNNGNAGSIGNTV